MKIRTFIMCESVEFPIKGNLSTFTINKMITYINAWNLPHEENIVIVLVFDEPINRETPLNITMLNPKDKPIISWVYNLSKNQTTCALRLRGIKFEDHGVHNLKLTYGNSKENQEFLGKYPLDLRKGGEDIE